MLSRKFHMHMASQIVLRKSACVLRARGMKQKVVGRKDNCAENA